MTSVLLGRTGSLPTTFPDRMQSSGTAKDVPARRNGLLRIKTRLNLDPNHAGPMREKTKASWEHFYKLFTISEEKHVAQQKVYWGCNAGKDERYGVQQLYKQLTKQTVQT